MILTAGPDAATVLEKAGLGNRRGCSDGHVFPNCAPLSRFPVSPAVAVGTARTFT